MMINPLDTLTRALEKACALGAEAGDAVMFETSGLSAARRMGKPEGIEQSENKALGLRAFIGQRQAIASTSDTGEDALAELAERVVAMAKAAPIDPDSLLAPESLCAPEVPDLDLNDAVAPDMAWLTGECRRAEEAALSVKGITNSEGAEASYSQNRVSLAIANNHGAHFARSYLASHFSVSVSVIAGSGAAMERDYEFASCRHRRNLADASGIGAAASVRALKRLNPRKPATCRAPVVFDPRVSRQWLGMLAGAISGSSVARGASFLKDALGAEVFSKNIRIIDDPHIKAGLGSRPFDAEGVKNGRRIIIDNGVLSTWLLDLRTAHKLGLETTGHASRGVAAPPSPASTNLYMEKGKLSPEALMSGINNGLYVTETFGMGVNLVTGDYSQGASGFWIENGEIAYPVSEITIAGHLREMFKTAAPADDLQFRYATNAPTLRVDGMTIAGA
ncbi:MAG: TldD/PmbA family protein [Pseudomonadota bacterium]|nr:TldD/PmbA family protein [Pseudomonadota bacterium]MDE3037352.1 TldD/PmbA family protein [Pseudomonadota bacterium]